MTVQTHAHTPTPFLVFFFKKICINHSNHLLNDVHNSRSTSNDAITNSSETNNSTPKLLLLVEPVDGRTNNAAAVLFTTSNAEAHTTICPLLDMTARLLVRDTKKPGPFACKTSGDCAHDAILAIMTALELSFAHKMSCLLLFTLTDGAVSKHMPH